MQSSTQERRVRRSHVPATALQWLLEAQVSRGALSSAVLASDEGLVVASCKGDRDADTLAAFAPMVASGARLSGYEREYSDVSVHSFVVRGEKLHLALRGGDRSAHSTLASFGMAGAERILRA